MKYTPRQVWSEVLESSVINCGRILTVGQSLLAMLGKSFLLYSSLFISNPFLNGVLL